MSEQRQQPKRSRQVHYLVFSLLVSAGIFGYIFSRVSLAEVADIILGITLPWLLLFFLFSFTMSLFRTWRYQYVLELSGHRAAPMTLFLITLLRNFFSDLLPARIGTLIYIYLVKSRLGLPLGPVVSSFANAFLFDLISLAVLVVVAVTVISLASQSALALTAAGLGLAALSLVVLSLLPWGCAQAESLLERIGWIPAETRLKVVAFFKECEEHLRLAKEQGAYLPILALSLAVRLSKYLCYYALFLGLVIPLGYTVAELPLPKVFLGLCSAELAASLPISGIAGFGAYEGAWSLVFQLLGYPERVAVLTSVSHHLFTQVYGYSLGALALLLLLVPRLQTPPAKKSPSGKHFWLKYCCVVAAVVLLTLAIYPSGTKANGAPGDAAAKPHPSQAALSGRIVYERPDGIYLTDITGGKATRLAAPGRHPRWSPDGKKVVFIRQNSIMELELTASGPEELARAGNAGTVSYNGDGTAILFSDGTVLKRIELATGTVTELLRDGDFRELGVSRDSNRLAATVKGLTGYRVRVFDLNSGGVRTVSRGCSASISPDGTLVTVNGKDHRHLELYSWQDLRLQGSIAAPDGGRFDNQFWSNHQDWLVSTSEGNHKDIYIHHISGGTPRQVTFTGDCDRAHLFVDR